VRAVAIALGHPYRPAVVRGLWLQAELVAMATDLAEVVGAAVGLNLLFGIPLAAAGLTAALAAFAVLAIPQGVPAVRARHRIPAAGRAGRAGRVRL
jgi:NRAMP (natural resistance-associated macrophage protein)-like metal ion transporter